jgi:hypothetical protein
MTSERMIAANRRNGRRGRGPRTASGKAVSSRNSLRHGLAVRLLDEPAACAQVESLAQAIAGAGADNARLSLARILAEAQLDLARIQAVKVKMMNAHLKASASDATTRGDDVTPNLQIGEAGFETGDATAGTEDTQELGAPPSIEVLRQLLRLERYENSAISRRRRAMRALSCGGNLVEWINIDSNLK